MTYLVKYVGGPNDQKIREFDSLGTTWSRSDWYRDEDGNAIGYYEYPGPPSGEEYWVTREEFKEQEKNASAS